MASETNVTVIGRSATLRGELSGDCDVQIDGSVEGSVHATGARITVGPDATVRALLSGQEIIVYGRVEGELRATGRAELRSSSTVVGDVFAARLSVEEEATLRGHVDSVQPAEHSAAEGSVPRAPQAWGRLHTSRDSGTHIPSGLAAAAASVATSQRPTGVPGEPSPARGAEPKKS